jgi:O-antigen ligase
LSSGRISSISYEPPFFAVYLISISGWMFSYILTERSRLKYLPTTAIIILTYYSGSRTGLIVIFIQLIFFLSIILNKKQKIIASLTFIGFITFTSFFFLTVNQSNALNDISKKIESLDFKGNLKKNISNQSRFGIQYASLKVFSENPIIGVGFGQQGFHARYHYPLWAKNDNWEFEHIYLNSKEPSFPPGYNLYTRLLAETGIIGIIIFLSLIFVTIKQSFTFIKNKDFETRVIGIILSTTLVGLYINWLQIDTFRVYIFWVSLCLLMQVSNQKQQKCL